MSRQTRRAFLRDAALGGAGLVILSSSRSALTYAANAKLNVALVGVGGRGKWYVDVMPRQANVVAFCDVNDSKAEAAYRAHPDVPKFHDFREMLDKKSKEIEGVMVAAPDHVHAVISLAVMRAGKHLFCEKPLTGCIHEARVVRDVASKCRLATRMGNQGSASAQFRRGVELIEDGALGEIREAYVWCEGGGPDVKETPKGTPPVPPYLKWDLWLGPNRDRPFHPQWLNWNAWREFGTYLPGPPYSRQKVRVLLSLDLAKTPEPTTDPKQAWLKEHVKRQEAFTGREKDYAISWVRTHGKGRVFYCSLGVDWRTSLSPVFLRHLLAGIQFAIGDLPADTTPSTK